MAKREDTEQTRQMELGSFLRARRERLRPEQLGLPKRARRRTPGLRREEVAELIGIGVTWYTWLEQGRTIQVSTDVLENLARVFQLSADERTYLFQLAQRPSPSASTEAPEEVPSILRDLLTTLEPVPAHIRDRRWNVLAWNRPESILVDWYAYPPNERNIVWQHFMNPRFRQNMVNWERETRSMVSEFRMATGEHSEEPWFTSLIQRLQELSPEFRNWWPLHEVRRTRELPVEIQHPQLGYLVFRPAPTSTRSRDSGHECCRAQLNRTLRTDCAQADGYQG